MLVSRCCSAIQAQNHIGVQKFLNVCVTFVVLEGGEAVIALSKDSEIHQNQICEGNGIAPLVRLLRSGRIAEGTLLSVIKALGTMCIGL